MADVYQTTRFDKVVAESIHGHGYDNGSRAGDGSPYLTWDIRAAKAYQPGEKAPKGFRLKRRRGTYRSRVAGGGWFHSQGTTMG